MYAKLPMKAWGKTWQVSAYSWETIELDAAAARTDRTAWHARDYRDGSTPPDRYKATNRHRLAIGPDHDNTRRVCNSDAWRTQPDRWWSYRHAGTAPHRWTQPYSHAAAQAHRWSYPHGRLANGRTLADS